MLAEMQENHGRAEVIYLILSAVQKKPLYERMHETDIAGNVGLDVDVVANYLDCMVERDLLSFVRGGYITTFDGKRYCADFEKFMSEFPLNLIE